MNGNFPHDMLLLSDYPQKLFNFFFVRLVYEKYWSNKSFLLCLQTPKNTKKNHAGWDSWRKKYQQFIFLTTRSRKFSFSWTDLDPPQPQTKLFRNSCSEIFFHSLLSKVRVERECFGKTWLRMNCESIRNKWVLSESIKSVSRVW